MMYQDKQQCCPVLTRNLPKDPALPKSAPLSSFSVLVCSLRDSTQHGSLHQQKFFFEESAQSFDAGRIKTCFESGKLGRGDFSLARELRNMIRRYKICIDLNSITRALAEMDELSYMLKIHLAETIRIAIAENGGKADVGLLLEAVRKDDGYSVGSRLLEALADLVKDLSEGELQTLKQAIEKHQIFDRPYQESSISSLKIELVQRNLSFQRSQTPECKVGLKIGKISMPQLTKTKNQIKIKIKNVNQNSEETEIKNMNLEELKNRRRNLNKNSNQQVLPSFREQDGSRQSWYRGTYTNVKQIYQSVVFLKEQITKDDKSYIEGKLISHTYFFDRKTFSGGLVGNVLIDRMIVRIILTLAKQKKYHITKEVLNKLMQLCDTLEKTQNFILLGTQYKVTLCGNNKRKGCGYCIGCKMYNSDVPPQNECNEIEEPLAKKVTDIKNREKKQGWFEFENDEHRESYGKVVGQLVDTIKEEVQLLRIDALETVFYLNQSSRGKIFKNISNDHFNRIVSFAEDPSEKGQVKKIAIRIAYQSVDDAEKEKDSKLISLSLKNIEMSTEELDLQIGYLLASVFGADERILEIFKKTGAVMRIFHCLLRRELSSNNRKNLCEFIFVYFEESKEQIPQQILKDIVTTVGQLSIWSVDIIPNLLMILWLGVKKQQLTANQIPILLKKMPDLNKIDKGQKIGNIIILILSQYHQLIEDFDMNVLGFKLEESQVPQIQGIQVKFKEGKEESQMSSISILTAQIIWRNIKGDKLSVLPNQETIKYLLRAFLEGDKQTCIKTAKVLYELKDNALLSRAQLNSIRDHIDSSVLDISVNSKLIFSRNIVKLEPNESDLETLTDIYEFKNIVVGQNDYTAELNENVLRVLQIRYRQVLFQTSKVYDLLALILHSELKNEDYQVIGRVLRIFKYQVQLGVRLDRPIVNALENQSLFLMDKNQKLYRQSVEIIGLLIRSQHQISNRVLSIYRDILFEGHIDKRYQESYQILRIADANCILDRSLFNTLQIERAAQALSVEECPQNDHILQFFKHQIQQCEKLTGLAFKKLSYLMGNCECVQIIENAIRNNDILPKCVIENIVNFVHEKKDNSRILQLVMTAVNQNMELDEKLVNRLQSIYLQSSQCENCLSEIFVQMMHKETYFQEEVFQKICQQSFSSELKGADCLKLSKIVLNFLNADQSSDLLPNICGVLNTMVGKVTSTEILLNLIRSYHKVLSRIISQDSQKHNLIIFTPEIFDLLVEKVKYAECFDLTECSLQIFSHQKIYDQLSEKTKASIHVIQTRLTSDQELVENLLQHEGFEIHFSPTEFRRLEKNLSHQSGDNKMKILSVLEKVGNIEEMTEALARILSDMFSYSESELLTKKSERILFTAMERGLKLQEEVCFKLLSKRDRSTIVEYLKKFNSSFPEEVYKLSIFTSLEKIIDQKEEFVSTMKTLKTRADKGFEIPSFLRLELLRINSFSIEAEIYSEIKHLLADVLCIITKQDYQQFEWEDQEITKSVKCRSFKRGAVFTIEESLKERIIDSSNSSEGELELLETSEAYLGILRKEFDENSLQILQIVFRVLEISTFCSFNLNLGEMLLVCCQRYKFPQFWIRIMSSCLYRHHGIIKYYCFRALRRLRETSSDCYDFEIFNKWRSEVKTELMNATNSLQIDDNLIEKIVSLKYCDQSLLTKINNGRFYWQATLSNLKEKHDLDPVEVGQLCTKWNELDKKITNLRLKEAFLVNLNISTNEGWEKARQKIGVMKSYCSPEMENELVNYPQKFNNVPQLALHYVIRTITSENCSSKSRDVINFVNKAAQKISHFLLFSVLMKISHLTDVREFKNFISFICNHSIADQDIRVYEFIQGRRPVDVLLRSLQIQLLGKYFQSRSVDRISLATMFDELLSFQWEFNQLQLSLKRLKQCSQVNIGKMQAIMIEFWTTVANYRLSSSLASELQTIVQGPFQNWLKDLNKVIVKEKYFSSVKTRQLNELSEELRKKNPDLTNSYVEMLTESVRKAKQRSLTSIVYRSLGKQIKISEFDKSLISQWARKIRQSVINWDWDIVIQCIAVINKANSIITGYHFKDAQILSCLLLLGAQQDKGRLLQVSTGEGKSTIISTFAIIKALQGHKVDIITSSPVLAERDAKQKEKLYSMFRLTCAHNNDITPYYKGKKKCYEKDIIYGDASQFQFDTLRDIYSRLGTLGERKKDIAIVDQVDSMLVDDSSKIVRLSSSIAGLDQLQIMYHFIWSQLIELQSRVLVREGKVYILKQRIEDQEQLATLTDDFLRASAKIIEYAHLDDFFKTHLLDYSNKLLASKKISLPKNFEPFLKKQVPKWVNNSMTATMYHENIHYVIDQGIIKPVDFNNTGIVQSSTNWSDGLHQFLQLKHGLKMTSETFTTNFLSNTGYFRSFGSNLFGLTGTIGSECVKEVLFETYKTDIVSVPRSCVEQYIGLPTVIIPNHHVWIQKVARAAISESKKERGVLILCETIQDVLDISKRINSEYHSHFVKLYTMNDMNQEQSLELIKKKEIIVATNLAGRGMDIKTDEIEGSGGLHVIFSFMPTNQRVEQQGFGRSGRQGKRGTGQMIINVKRLPQEYQTIQKIQGCQVQQLRDNFEREKMNAFVKHQLKIILIKDKLFQRFCCLLDSIRKSLRSKYTVFNAVRNLSWKNLKTSVMEDASIEELNFVSSVEEKWALLLRAVDDGDIDLDIFQNQYSKLEETILRQIQANKLQIIENPFYHITIANDLLVNNSFKDESIKHANQHLDSAIQKDECACIAAHMGKGWAALKGNYRLFSENSRNPKYKLQATQHFTKTLSLGQIEMAQLSGAQLLVDQTTGPDCDLFKQLSEKQNILGSYCNSIDANIKSIEKSLRLVNVSKKKLYQNKHSTYTFNSNDKDRDDYSLEVYWSNEEYLKKRKQELLQDKKLLTKKSDYEYTEAKFDIEFLDLTVRSDMELKAITSECSGVSELDQALDILKFVYLDIEKQSILHRGKRQIMKKGTEIIHQGKQKIQQIYNYLSHQNNQQHDFQQKKVTRMNESENPTISIEAKAGNIIFTADGNELRQLLNPNHEQTGLNATSVLNILENEGNECLESINSVLNKVNMSLPVYKSKRVKLEIMDRNNQNNLSTKEWDYGNTKEIRKFIQSQKSENLIYNIIFYDSNPHWKNLSERVFSETQCLSIELDQLPISELSRLKQDMSQCKQFCNTYSIEIISEASKKGVAMFLQELNESGNHGINFLEISYENNTKKQVLYLNKAAQYLNSQIKGMFSARFSYISLNIVERICIFFEKNQQKKNEQSANIFKIRFHQIRILNTKVRSKVLDIIKSKYISATFENVQYPLAQFLIPVLREKGITFKIKFTNFDHQSFKILLEAAQNRIKAEEMQILKEKSLSELFFNLIKPELELQEFAARGIEYTLDVNEKKFVPWRNIVAVTLLASAQVGLGIFLVATGFGATVGMGLITQGVADLFTAARAYATRQFTWSDYAKQKAVSLVVSAVSFGVNKLKDAAKGANHAFRGTAKEIIKFAEQQTVEQLVVRQGKSIGTAVVMTSKNLVNLAFKQTGTVILENGIRETLTYSVDRLSNFAFDSLRPNISAYIQQRVLSKFCSQILKKLIYDLYSIESLQQKKQKNKNKGDKSNKNKLKTRIQAIIQKSLSPQNSWLKRQWSSIGGPLCKGVLSSSERVGTNFSMGLRIIGTLQGLTEVMTIIDHVHHQLVIKLIEMHQQQCSIKQILISQCGLPCENAQSIVEKLANEKVVSYQYYKRNEEPDISFEGVRKVLEKIDQLDPTSKQTIKQSQYKYESIHFHILKSRVQNSEAYWNIFRLYEQQLSKREVSDLSEIMKSVSDKLTDQIIRTIESQMISPWTSFAAGELTKFASKRFQHNFLVDEDQCTDEQKQNKKHYEKIKKKEEGGLTLTPQQKQFVSNYDPYITFSSQILANAKDYTIAYSQCQNLHFATKESQSNSTSISREAKEYAQKIKNGGPLTAADLHSVAKQNDIKLRIVDDPNYQLTPEDKAKGVQVVFYQEKQDLTGKSVTGHFVLLGQKVSSSGGNNCGLDIISHILKEKGVKKSAESLRNEASAYIQKNGDNYTKSLEGVSWVHERYEKQAKRLLCVGGKVEQPKHMKQICERYKPCNRNCIYIPVPIHSGTVQDIANWIIGDYLDFLAHGVNDSNAAFPTIVCQSNNQQQLQLLKNTINHIIIQQKKHNSPQNKIKLERVAKIFNSKCQNISTSFPDNSENRNYNVSIIGHGAAWTKNIKIGGTWITTESLVNEHRIQEKVPRNTTIICDNCYSAVSKQLTGPQINHILQPQNQTQLNAVVCNDKTVLNSLAQEIDKKQEGMQAKDRKITKIVGFPQATSMYGYNKHKLYQAIKGRDWIEICDKNDCVIKLELTYSK